MIWGAWGDWLDVANGRNASLGWSLPSPFSFLVFALEHPFVFAGDRVVRGAGELGLATEKEAFREMLPLCCVGLMMCPV